MNTSKKKRVLVGLSGGVDSAVSAYLLLKGGFEVEGVFMKNWSSTTGLKSSDCPWLEDRREALRVAAFLRIPLHTVDYEGEYEERVLKYFFEEYEAGRTPNPDVMCNKEIKFKLLYEWAMKKGFDYLATGHYARIGANPKLEELKLFKAIDHTKDQTYFIYNLETEQLKHILFPIGELKKTQVRTLAKKIKLPNANRKESMGLCFVGKIRLKEFLEQKVKSTPGDIMITDGKFIGKHRGLAFYTIGQRHGIEIGEGGPYYVISKDQRLNRLIVTRDSNDLVNTKKVSLSSVHLLNKNNSASTRVQARGRHLGDLAWGRLQLGEKANFEFEKPHEIIASGQSLVFYDGEICLGGGIVE